MQFSYFFNRSYRYRKERRFSEELILKRVNKNVIFENVNRKKLLKEFSYQLNSISQHVLQQQKKISEQRKKE